jgi:hypothetical protein
MTEKLNRREAAKAVAAAGGLLMLGGFASADRREEPRTLSGEWLNGGKLDEPCAIFQHGRMLILINENGDIASGRMTGINKFTVLKGWDDGVVGKVVERGKEIAWKGGGSWKRR